MKKRTKWKNDGHFISVFFFFFLLGGGGGGGGGVFKFLLGPVTGVLSRKSVGGGDEEGGSF